VLAADSWRFFHLVEVMGFFEELLVGLDGALPVNLAAWTLSRWRFGQALSDFVPVDSQFALLR